ncbi:hypothetical protein [Carnobacterium divergens]|uniref:hypothetical protein n=1 Tax=Carnobacterium divergens TaxID=2748 RepID=UPI0007F43D62|nr:hypothetical protein [Carnobacterium divergens]SBO17433.1 phage protein [Carnobacterium divergens]
MEYKNIKTGAVFSSPCVINGGNWVVAETNEPKESASKKIEKPIEQEVDKQQQANQKKVESEVAENKQGDEAYDGITRAQIMQELDAFGIEYDKKANKKELYELMMQGK